MWKWLYLMTNFSHCVDPILYTAGGLEDDSKVNFVTYLNYDHADWLTITLGAQKNVKLGNGITWTPQYNVSLMKPWLKSMFNGQEKCFCHPMLTLQLGNILALPHDWLLQADFNMHTHGNTGSNIYVDSTNPMLSLSISKDFFQHRLNVKLTGNDIFNGGINHVMLYSNRMMFRFGKWRTMIPVASNSPCATDSMLPHRSIRVQVPVMPRRTDCSMTPIH